MKENKKAKFWIRFGGKTIDILLLISFLIFILFFCVKKSGNSFEFISPFYFYLWDLLVILFIFLYFYILPIISNGFTLGFWVFRIKIKYNKNHWKEQAIRESTFSFIYIINALCLMLIINHTLINALVANDNKALNKLGAWDKARVSVYITITSIGVLLSTVVGISIIIKKGEGLNDVLSNSQAIYINKFIIKNKQQNSTKGIYKPNPVKVEIIEWIE